MQTFSKFVLSGLLALATTSALAQATSTPSASPQAAPAPSAPMPGMMMQQGSGQSGSGTQAQPQQGGMMQCPMMQRSAQSAEAVKQLQQQVTEMRTMLEQMSKNR